MPLTTVTAIKESRKSVSTKVQSFDSLINELKKSKSSKKAQPLRDCLKTKQFIKDWANLAASGRYNLNNLKEVMLLLIAND